MAITTPQTTFSSNLNSMLSPVSMIKRNMCNAFDFKISAKDSLSFLFTTKEFFKP